MEDPANIITGVPSFRTFLAEQEAEQKRAVLTTKTAKADTLAAQIPKFSEFQPEPTARDQAIAAAVPGLTADQTSKFKASRAAKQIDHLMPPDVPNKADKVDIAASRFEALKAGGHLDTPEAAQIKLFLQRNGWDVGKDYIKPAVQAPGAYPHWEQSLAEMAAEPPKPTEKLGFAGGYPRMTPTDPAAVAKTVDIATRPFQYLSTMAAGAQRRIGASVAAIGGSDAAAKALQSYGLADIFNAAAERFYTGQTPKGYEQPVGELYKLAVEKFGGDPDKAVHRVIEETLAGVADPVNYIAPEAIAERLGLVKAGERVPFAETPTKAGPMDRLAMTEGAGSKLKEPVTVEGAAATGAKPKVVLPREGSNAEAVRSDAGQVREGSTQGQPEVQRGAVQSSGDLQQQAQVAASDRQQQEAITSSPPTSLTRNFRAGSNDATLTFASETQRDLYDLAANERYAMRGGQDKASQRAVKDTGPIKTRLAEQLGISEAEVSTLARSVHDDVKAQMKGVQHLETRAVTDNVLAEATNANQESIPSQPGREGAAGSAQAGAGQVAEAARTTEAPPPAETQTLTSPAAQVAEGERTARNLPPVEKQAYTPPSEAYKAGKDVAPEQARALAASVAKEPRPLTTAEVGTLGYDRARLLNEHRAARDAVDSAITSGDEAKIAEAKARLIRVESDFDLNDQALAKGGREQSAAFNARRMLVRDDYSYAGVLQRAKIAAGEAVKPEVRAQLETLTNRLDAAEARLAANETAVQNQAAELNVRRMARQEGLSSRKSVRAETKAQLDADFAALKDQFAVARKEAGGVHGAGLASLDPEGKLTDLIGKMAANRVRAGVTQLADIVDEIHVALRDKVEGLTPDHIREALAKGDTSNVLQDAKTRRLTASRNAAQQAVDEAVAAQAKPQPSDYFMSWRRGILLSGSQVLAKLSSAAGLRYGFRVAEDVAGAGLNKLPGISSIAAKAGGEGLTSIKAEAAALKATFSKAMLTDTWQKLTTGKSELDLLFGKAGKATPAATNAFTEMTGFFGRLHGALKNPVQRSGFFRYLEQEAEAAIKTGADPHNPVTAMELGAKAYERANRDILMQDNALHEAWNTGLNKLGASGPIGKVIAGAGRFTFPIVKIPLNYVGETLSHAAGGAEAIIRVAAAHGVEGLSEADAAAVMRALKKGTVGAGLFTVGFLNPDNVGGYYQRGEKRGLDEAQAGGLRLFGYNVPQLLVHNPAMEMLQLGATVRRVSQAMKHGEPQGLAAGAQAAGVGLAEEVPFIGEAVKMARATESKSATTKYAGGMVESLIVPPDVQRIAKIQDDTTARSLGAKYLEPKPAKRQASSILDVVQSGIPGLRQKLPDSDQQKQQKALRKLMGLE